MKILLAIDRSDASKKAVHFVGNTLAGGSSGEAAITLLHVVESIPDYLASRASGESADSAYRQVADEWDNARKSEGEDLIDVSRQALIEMGVPSTIIDAKLVVKESRPESKKVVAAIAIIEEMKKGDYSVVCLGRRGTAIVEGEFVGSVAEKVLREAVGRSVCVVD